MGSGEAVACPESVVLWIGNGLMNTCIQKSGGRRGFTIVEVVVAMVLVGIFVLAAMSSMAFGRIQSAKDKDSGIVLDFATHYLELARAIPFSDLKSGNALNPLCDGTAGAPNIRIPATASWVSLSSVDYTTFHPELVWLAPRNPEMRVTLSTTQKDGTDHTKLLRVELRWDAPLQQGGKLNARMDMARFRDL